MSSKKQCKERYICIVSYLLLSFFLLFFYLMIFFEIESIVLKLIFFLFLSFLGLGILLEKELIKEKRFDITKKAGVLISVPIAAVVTFFLSVNANFGPVIASGAVGLFYALIASHLGNSWKKLSAPVYCGSFVGMSSPMVLTGCWMVGIAGILAGIILILSGEVYKGIGGKLGTIAFVGSTTVKKLILALLGM
jgi:hypothetical protein